jgi:hypothetical protein
LLQSMSADFRGNTGESWSRALSYLIRNKLLVEPDEKNRVRQPAKLRLPRENPSPRREGGVGRSCIASARRRLTR